MLNISYTVWTVNDILDNRYPAAVSICAWFFEKSIWEIITNSKKNWFQNKLDFLFSSNLIFIACVACKNQFRNQIDFLYFLNLISRNWKKIEWHSIFQKSSRDRQGVWPVEHFFHHKRLHLSEVTFYKIHTLAI